MRTSFTRFPDPSTLSRRSLLGAALLAGTGLARAQPGGNVSRIIVPFAAGGAREMPARLILNEFSKEVGQTWIIENKPGAGGEIGTSFVGHAAPDGQTLVMAASSHFVTAATRVKPAYEPVADFAPVALIGNQNYVLMVQSAMNVKNVAELIAYAKKQPPGTLNYNSAGVASSTHLAGAYFASLAGIQMTHIPYKSTQEAANDVMGGRGHIVFVPTAGVGVYLKDPRVRVIGTTGDTRASLLPDVPTIAQGGLPKYQFESWFGLLAPAKTPAAVVTKLNAAVNKVLAMPDVKQRLENFGIEVAPMSVAGFTKIFLADQQLMAKIVKDSGLTRE
jgi:tripartite-type tricarboxylate transporter receptor subunit TctC